MLKAQLVHCKTTMEKLHILFPCRFGLRSKHVCVIEVKILINMLNLNIFYKIIKHLDNETVRQSQTMHFHHFYSQNKKTEFLTTLLPLWSFSYRCVYYSLSQKNSQTVNTFCNRKN